MNEVSMKQMKRIVSCLIAALLLVCCAAALAQEILYTATVTKDMTIRQTKSTSGKKLGSVEANEIIHVIEYGKEWTKVVKDDVTGYLLTKNVTNLAVAAGYDDEAAAQFVAVAEKAATIRSEKSKSAQKLQEYAAGDQVCILELGKNWHRVVKNGVEGYVLSSLIVNVEPARDDVVLPQDFEQRVAFEHVYTAKADVNLSIRKEKNPNSRLLGTVYENEEVAVMMTDGEWAYVRKDGETGYVRADHLRYYKRLDPYGPLVPGTVVYPYAARAIEDVEILHSETGVLLRVAPAGSVIPVSALAEDMSVTLPYDRITGRIAATGSIEMEPCVAWDEAQPGDLLAVFATYYDPQQRTQTQVGRLHNIMQGVTRLDGVVFPAGTKFSFNEYCAPYTKGNGYQEGPIINYTSSDKLGYGGGICQVSTTLYNAILQIPIHVSLHYVHSSYGISYAPLDFDAAVGAGNIDLRLENTLPYDVRFALEADGGVLTVCVYRAE
ncbi:MAG: VanW family protein [Clostridia bacterium]|nr:VanW family protein [Clostridia bacterium]